MSIVADLHAHTYASDGELSPTQLVDRAADAGLEALAVTDHDSTGGVDEALARGAERGLEIVPGCELTIYENGIERHMLALFIDHRAPAFVELMRTLRETRRVRALKMAERLRAAGYAIDDQEILDAAGSAESIGKPHVAAALVKRGHARTAQDAHLRFLGRGKVADVPKERLTLEAGVAAVHGAGGLTFIAHPGVMPHDELLAAFFRRGLDGIEAIYPSHSEVNRRFYAGLARRYERLVSGGSDFHGPRVRPQARLGMAGLTRLEFDALKETALRRRALKAK
jgi:3',5'-nucleoside bisphosphate phosphatase